MTRKESSLKHMWGLMFASYFFKFSSFTKWSVLFSKHLVTISICVHIKELLIIILISFFI